MRKIRYTKCGVKSANLSCWLMEMFRTKMLDHPVRFLTSIMVLEAAMPDCSPFDRQDRRHRSHQLLHLVGQPSQALLIRPYLKRRLRLANQFFLIHIISSPWFQRNQALFFHKSIKQLLSILVRLLITMQTAQAWDQCIHKFKLLNHHLVATITNKRETARQVIYYVIFWTVL